jgi:hypothetical protein
VVIARSGDAAGGLGWGLSVGVIGDGAKRCQLDGPVSAHGYAALKQQAKPESAVNRLDWMHHVPEGGSS